MDRDVLKEILPNNVEATSSLQKSCAKPRLSILRAFDPCYESPAKTPQNSDLSNILSTKDEELFTESLKHPLISFGSTLEEPMDFEESQSFHEAMDITYQANELDLFSDANSTAIIPKGDTLVNLTDRGIELKQRMEGLVDEIIDNIQENCQPCGDLDKSFCCSNDSSLGNNPQVLNSTAVLDKTFDGAAVETQTVQLHKTTTEENPEVCQLSPPEIKISPPTPIKETRDNFSPAQISPPKPIESPKSEVPIQHQSFDDVPIQRKKIELERQIEINDGVIISTISETQHTISGLDKEVQNSTVEDSPSSLGVVEPMKTDEKSQEETKYAALFEDQSIVVKPIQTNQHESEDIQTEDLNTTVGDVMAEEHRIAQNETNPIQTDENLVKPIQTNQHETEDIQTEDLNTTVGDVMAEEHRIAQNQTNPIQTNGNPVKPIQTNQHESENLNTTVGDVMAEEHRIAQNQTNPIQTDENLVKPIQTNQQESEDIQTKDLNTTVVVMAEEHRITQNQTNPIQTDENHVKPIQTNQYKSEDIQTEDLKTTVGHVKVEAHCIEQNRTNSIQTPVKPIQANQDESKYIHPEDLKTTVVDVKVDEHCTEQNQTNLIQTDKNPVKPIQANQHKSKYIQTEDLKTTVVDVTVDKACIEQNRTNPIQTGENPGQSKEPEVIEKIVYKTVPDPKLVAENKQLLKKLEIYKHRDKEMQNTLEMYEAHFQQQIDETVKSREEYSLMQKHFATLEIAFSDVHQKYERTKTVVEGYRTNEKTLKEILASTNAELVKSEQECSQLRQTVNEKVKACTALVNTERDKMQADMNKAASVIKRLEIKVNSLSSSLDQKTKECSDLAKLVDEITQ